MSHNTKQFLIILGAVAGVIMIFISFLYYIESLRTGQSTIPEQLQSQLVGLMTILLVGAGTGFTTWMSRRNAQSTQQKVASGLKETKDVLANGITAEIPATTAQLVKEEAAMVAQKVHEEAEATAAKLAADLAEYKERTARIEALLLKQLGMNDTTDSDEHGGPEG